MPEFLSLKTFGDERGHLTVIEKVLPFDIKRIFYIYGVDSSTRGFHRHKKTIQAAVCITGSCCIVCQPGPGLPMTRFHLRQPVDCVVLYPNDWHYLTDFTPGTILMVLASEYFDPDDYIFEPYGP
jgi:hypothetical protein